MICDICKKRENCYWGKSKAYFSGGCEMFEENDGAEEDFCESCGEPIPKGFQLCPNCWVKFGEGKYYE